MQPYDAVLFKPPAPLARIRMRRSGSTDTLDDIPMLLDSGSDVTLIPKAPALALGVAINPGLGAKN